MKPSAPAARAVEPGAGLPFLAAVADWVSGCILTDCELFCKGNVERISAVGRCAVAREVEEWVHAVEGAPPRKTARRELAGVLLVGERSPAEELSGGTRGTVA